MVDTTTAPTEPATVVEPNLHSTEHLPPDRSAASQAVDMTAHSPSWACPAAAEAFVHSSDRRRIRRGSGCRSRRSARCRLLRRVGFRVKTGLPDDGDSDSPSVAHGMCLCQLDDPVVSSTSGESERYSSYCCEAYGLVSGSTTIVRMHASRISTVRGSARVDPEF